jgi:23S rRNA (cytidine1920-2'-O)/16S rRNA (cytidine1409-2'-O)-methyltransferase
MRQILQLEAHMEIGSATAEPVRKTIRARELFRAAVASAVAGPVSIGMTTRLRADLLLVERGLFDSRAKAQAAIAAGLVTADGALVRKPSEALRAGAVLQAAPEHPYVSRGALKLAAALDHFHIDPARRICLDAGASTGGFTELLLQRAARHVYAVDVGRDQLHARLRADARVTSWEQTDIRSVTADRLPEPPDLISVDVSFISLKRVLPAAMALAAPSAQLIALIKPQFEAGRGLLKKGIVREPRVHAAVCDDIAGFVEGLGWRLLGVIASPIEGGDGNREFLLAAERA